MIERITGHIVITIASAAGLIAAPRLVAGQLLELSCCAMTDDYFAFLMIRSNLTTFSITV